MSILLLAILPGTIRAEDGSEVYKWVDEKGQVHYGDRPAEQPATQIQIRQPGGPDTVYRRELEKQFKLLNIYSEDRMEQQQLEDGKKKTEAVRIANCNSAKKNLDSIRTASYLFVSTDDPLNPRVLSNEERAQQTATAEAEVRNWCR